MVKPIDAEEREKILLHYVINGSMRKASQEFNRGEGTISKLVKNNQEELERIREEYTKKTRTKFIAQADKIIENGMNLLNRNIESALQNSEDIEKAIQEVKKDSEFTNSERATAIKLLKSAELTSLKEVAIVVGTIYDKRALASGESTQNNEVIFRIPDSMKDLAQ